MKKQVRPLAVVIDADFGVMSTAVRVLTKARYQVIGRLSPRGLVETVRSLRPELLLLGVPFWRQGWGSLFRSESPETLVFPMGDAAEEAGALPVERLPGLVHRAG